jgi:peptide/nickel transport system ATP-binding protein
MNSQAAPAEPVLAVQDLHLAFPVYRGRVQALNGVSLTVGAGEVVGLVGESGSGKSVVSMTAMRLLVPGSYRIPRGSVTMLGQDVLAASEADMLALRGSQVAMIFQEPMTALNPTRRVGDQMVEVIRRHQPLSRAQARAQAVALLQDMHVADPRAVLGVYPFELSGGMRQRVLLALAFSCEPRLLIADEPTTALDVTVQRQVLLLMRAKARAGNTAILFITHDMALVSQFCDRIYVLYAGAVVEEGPTAMVLGAPRHPYTHGLLGALPDRVAPRCDLEAIAGSVPDLTRLPAGCAFANRCPRVRPDCAAAPPRLPLDAAGTHFAACWAISEEDRP